MQLLVRNLSKAYPNGLQALKNVSLTIPPGVYALVGPHGAGKSTLMRILATLQEADSGSAQLDDIDVLRQKDEVRRTLGYLAQDFDVYPAVTAQDLLAHFALLRGITRHCERREVVEGLLRRVDLWEVRWQKLGTYAGGMRQRFGVAVALLGNPALLIIDEPSTRLVRAERVAFLNLLCEIGERRIVVLSTQDVEDVAERCTRMALIDRGEILLEAEPLRAMAEIAGRGWAPALTPARRGNTN